MGIRTIFYKRQLITLRVHIEKVQVITDSNENPYEEVPIKIILLEYTSQYSNKR